MKLITRILVSTELDYGKFSLRLIGSAMFSAISNTCPTTIIRRVYHIVEYHDRNFIGK